MTARSRDRRCIPNGQFETVRQLPQKSVAGRKNNLEVVFYRDAKVDDGRYANNGWMQELPDPITKMTWDNAVLVSRKTARELGVQNGDIVEIALNGRNVNGPIWTQPGMADYSLGLALGYGREKAGRVGTASASTRIKFSAENTSRPARRFARPARRTRWRRRKSLVHGRPSGGARGEPRRNLSRSTRILREKMHGDEPPVVKSLYPNPLDEAKKTALHQWGMAIDLNACVGCGTCVVACQSENNIPIVGKDQVQRGREMHWMRIDRYYTSDPKRKNNPSILRSQGGRKPDGREPAVCRMD